MVLNGIPHPQSMVPTFLPLCLSLDLNWFSITLMEFVILHRLASLVGSSDSPPGGKLFRAGTLVFHRGRTQDLLTR